MKFAVGDKVTIKYARKDWNGLRAVVKEIDYEEETYPYNLTLIDGTANGSFRAGDTANAWREEELVAYADDMRADVSEAVALLKKHGLAFRVYTREDVERMLDQYGQDDNEPLDTRTFREELVEFIMNGQDWKNLSQKGLDDEITLWQMVEGARNDHREWFVG